MNPKRAEHEKQVYGISTTTHIIACWRSSNSSSSSRSISISCSNEHAKAAPPNKTKTKKKAERRLARINILLLSSEFMRNFRMKSVFSELKRVLNQSAIMFSLCLNNFVTFFCVPTRQMHSLRGRQIQQIWDNLYFYFSVERKMSVKKWVMHGNGWDGWVNNQTWNLFPTRSIFVCYLKSLQQASHHKNKSM